MVFSIYFVFAHLLIQQWSHAELSKENAHRVTRSVCNRFAFLPPIRRAQVFETLGHHYSCPDFQAAFDSAVLHVRWIRQTNNLMVELCPFVPGESNLKFYIIEGTGSRVHGSCEGNLCIVFQVDGSRGCDK
jgi:hypothetical protein